MLSEKIEADHARRDALVAAMTALQPISALLLETGVSFHDMVKLVRRVYVDVAAAKQRATGSRPTISRIAASTGLSRPDVSEALSVPPIPSNASDLAPKAGDRILAGWRSDPEFLHNDGSPRALAYIDGNPSFADLVKRHGPDIPPRAMLRELLGAGQVTEVSEGNFLPTNSDNRMSESRAEAIVGFGPKMNALGSTLMRNIVSAPENGLFENLSVLSRIPPSSAPKVTRELERRCRTFAQSIDRYLMDQQPEGTDVLDEDPHSIGVMIAVVERAPEKDLPKRKRLKK